MEKKSEKGSRRELAALQKRLKAVDDHLKHLLRLLWLDIEQREEKIGAVPVEIGAQEIEKPLLGLYERFWTELLGPFHTLCLVMYAYEVAGEKGQAGSRFATVSNGHLTQSKRNFKYTLVSDEDTESLFKNVEYPILSVTYYVALDGDVKTNCAICEDWEAYCNLVKDESKEAREYQLQRYRVVLTKVNPERIRGEEEIIEVAVGMFIAFIADVAYDRGSAAKIRDKMSQLGEIPHNVRGHICDPLRKAVTERHEQWASTIMDYLYERTIYLEFLAREDEFEKRPEAQRAFIVEHFTERSMIDTVREFIELRLFVNEVKEEARWEALFADSLATLRSIEGQDKDLYICWMLTSALETVLENLTSNAINWGFGKDVKDGDRIDIEVEQENSQIHILFRDSGTGFDEDAKVATQTWTREGPFETGGTQGMGLRSRQMAIDSIKGEFSIDWGEPTANSRYHPTFKISLPKPYADDWEVEYWIAFAQREKVKRLLSV